MPKEKGIYRLSKKGHQQLSTEMEKLTGHSIEGYQCEEEISIGGRCPNGLGESSPIFLRGGQSLGSAVLKISH